MQKNESDNVQTRQRIAAISYDQYRTECCTAADEDGLNAMRCGALLCFVMRWSGGERDLMYAAAFIQAEEKRGRQV